MGKKNKKVFFYPYSVLMTENSGSWSNWIIKHTKKYMTNVTLLFVNYLQLDIVIVFICPVYAWILFDKL